MAIVAEAAKAKPLKIPGAGSFNTTGTTPGQVGAGGGSRAPGGGRVPRTNQPTRIAKGPRNPTTPARVTKPRVTPTGVPKQPGRPAAKAAPKKAPAKSPAYNPWEPQFKTQAQFNQGVQNLAKSTYEPKMTQLKEEEIGQRNLSQARETDAQQIYKQYGEQAQAAMQRAQAAMAEIASRQQAGTTQSQQALQAALTSPIAGLPQVADQSAYMNAALAESNLTQGNIAAQQTGIVNELAQNAANAPSAGLKNFQITERDALTKALAKITEERAGVTKEIPADVAKAQEALSKEELNRASTRLERELASQKLGIEGTYKAALGEAAKERASAANERNRASREIAAESNRAKKEIAAEKAAIANESAGQKRAEKEAQLRAKQWQAATSWFTNYVKFNPKSEFREGPGYNKAEQKAHQEKNMVPYRRNAMQAYTTLTQAYGLHAPEAFRLLRTAGGYFKVFADEHEEAFYHRGKYAPGSARALGPNVGKKLAGTLVNAARGK